VIPPYTYLYTYLHTTIGDVEYLSMYIHYGINEF
jgi:hypothetical protein